MRADVEGPVDSAARDRTLRKPSNLDYFASPRTAPSQVASISNAREGITVESEDLKRHELEAEL